MRAGVNLVLVVEDEFLVRLDAAFQLEDEGYEVLAAGSADEALALLLDAHPVDVLFTDVNMPGRIDGLQLAHHVRSNWPAVKVIITSARDYHGAQLPEQAVFLSKPYQIEALVGAIRGLVSQH